MAHTPRKLESELDSRQRLRCDARVCGGSTWHSRRGLAWVVGPSAGRAGGPLCIPKRNGEKGKEGGQGRPLSGLRSTEQDQVRVGCEQTVA
jgi:hypothetical protein